MMLTSFPVNYPEMVVEKSEGLTVSEKKLAALGYRTFLILWSYQNPYKMQLKGKKFFDLLIISLFLLIKTVHMETLVILALIGEDGTNERFKSLQNN